MSSIKIDELRPTMDYLLCVLESHGLSAPSVKDYASTFHAFEGYVRDLKIDVVDESICLNFIESRNGKRPKDLYEDPRSDSISRRMKALHFLMKYQEEGLHCHTGHRKRPPFSCPAEYKEEYEGYLKYLETSSLSESTILTRKDKTQAFLLFLASRGIPDVDAISAIDIDAFLLLYINNEIKYREAILCVLLSFLGYLYEKGYTPTNLKETLPHLRVPRSGGIPHAWKKEELTAILGAIDREDPAGKRDYAVLLLTIQSGLRAGDIRNLRLNDIDWGRKKLHLVMGKTGFLCRTETPGRDSVTRCCFHCFMIPAQGFQELIDLRIKNARTDSPAVVTLHGKGNKTRQVPVMSDTQALLKTYLEHYRYNPGISKGDNPLFTNQKKEPLSRWGISYIINKYVAKAKDAGLMDVDFPITPHVFRHSKAVHMVRAGINLIYIRDFLGHVDCSTTEIYARIDTELKRKAIEKACKDILPEQEYKDWTADADLMSFLDSLRT